MLLNELKKLKLSQELITIDRGCGDDDLTGEVLEVSESYISLILWTDEGEYDGVTVFEPDQIDEVFWGNREHHAIATLVKRHGKRPNIKFNSKDFYEIVFEAFSNYSYIGLYHEHCEDTYSICRLDSHDEEWLKIHTLGPKRTLSTLVKLVKQEDVTRIKVDSPYMNNIVALHERSL